MPSLRMLSLLAVGAQFYSSVASAHITLLEPIPRYPNAVSGENKACPCGVGMSNRVCNVEGDRSDPDRSLDRVTTLVAGSTVVFRFDEYVGHGGRYRVAFDREGADLEDFNAHILVDIPDPRGSIGNVGDGSIWEIPVPVPDTPCDNCTLQLIQMMDGNMVDLVPDPVGRSSYYQCADVVIVPGAADAGAVALAPEASDSGCSLGGLTSQAPWPALGAASLLVLARRRRRRAAR